MLISKQRAYFRKAIMLCLLMIFSQRSYGDEFVVRIIGPQSKEDTTHAYFEQLFTMALEYSLGQDTNIVLEKLPYSDELHGGVARLLNTKVIDLYWTATNSKIESELLPVRIPLVMGLLGYRVSITHQANSAKFKSLDDLKRYKACQLRHWTDVDILEFNGFTVVPTDSYERTFELTQKGRCDYYPRAIFEGYFELRAAQKRFPDLTMFEDLVLYYPFPLYVFTSVENKTLHSHLQTGLRHLVQSGKLLKHIQQSEITRHLFPLSKWQNKTIHQLQNPFLPENTPLDDKALWLDITHTLD